MTSQHPIGVLDSGMGGLSVLRELRKLLPHEDFLYCADCANAPWGDRGPDFILSRCRTMMHFMIDRGAKALVLACNTATAHAADTLREETSIPIIGIEPAVKPAAANSVTKHIAVIATTRTVTSSRYQRLIQRFADGVKVTSIGAPGLMNLVEKGELATEQTIALLHYYLDPVFASDADTLVLGCTHYPFLTQTIRSIAPREISILEPSAAVARVLKHRLEMIGALKASQEKGTETFFISGAAQKESVLKTLWSEQSFAQELCV